MSESARGTGTALSLFTFSALVAGISLGLWLGGLSDTPQQLLTLSSTLGSLWLNALKMTVLPLIIVLIITSVAGFKDREQLGRQTVVVLGLFATLILLVSLVTAVLAPVWQLLFDTSQLSSASNSIPLRTPPPFSEWILGLVPDNPFRAAVDGQVLPLVIFCFLFALAAGTIPEEMRSNLLSVLTAVKETMLRLVSWIMLLAPVGVFALALPLAANAGVELANQIAWFILWVCLLIIVCTALLYPIVGLFTPVSVWKFSKSSLPAQLIGFSTRSSLASLPAMFASARKMEIPDQTAGLVLPMAVSLFKFASPIARGSGTFFVAALYGVTVSPTDCLLIAGAIGLLSFYSPGIPSGGLLVMTPVYAAFGLPVEGIALLIGLDLIIDLFITFSNVTANLTVTAVVSRLRS